jgi:hypothetical protein
MKGNNLSTFVSPLGLVAMSLPKNLSPIQIAGEISTAMPFNAGTKSVPAMASVKIVLAIKLRNKSLI